MLFSSHAVFLHCSKPAVVSLMFLASCFHSPCVMLAWVSCHFNWPLKHLWGAPQSPLPWQGLPRQPGIVHKQDVVRPSELPEHQHGFDICGVLSLQDLFICEVVLPVDAHDGAEACETTPVASLTSFRGLRFLWFRDGWWAPRLCRPRSWWPDVVNGWCHMRFWRML